MSLRRLYLVIGTLSWSVCSTSVYAESAVEFNADFLRGQYEGQKSVDLSRFSYSGITPEGTYFADVYVNDRFKGRTEVEFVKEADSPKTFLCFTERLSALIDIKESALTPVTAMPQRHCEVFEQKVPNSKVTFDSGDLRLDVTVAQAFLTQRPAGYVAPSQWENGVPVAFLRYDANHYQSRYAHSRTTSDYLGIDAGVNFLGWSLRHQGTKEWVDGKGLSYHSQSTYLQHDIPFLRAQFRMGDFYANSNLLDGFSIRGVQIASDDSMLAPSERGYAPIIRGIANSNAKVRILQNGNLLRELTVPAGPFSIDDLQPMGYGGDIQVEIHEANGEVRTFAVPFTAVAQLIRPGYSRYQLAFGRYRYGNQISKENVLQATWQYGLTNNLTLNAGGIFSKNYQAYLGGVAFNTPIGDFSTSTTLSRATFLSSRRTLRGYSIYASYNTRIEPTDTNVTLAAYRYSSKNFYSLQEVMFANNGVGYDENALRFVNDYHPKHRFQISISQNLKQGLGYLYLTGSSSSYWNNSNRLSEYQVGYSNTYKSVNYSISFGQSRTADGRKDNRVYMSLSFPLGGGETRAYVNQSLSYSNKRYSSISSLSGALDKEGRYSYGLSFNKTQHGSSSIAANLNNYTSVARLGASWSRDSQSNQQLSVSASGAVVAHPKGITLADTIGDTFAIVHAKGARGASINGSTNTIDYFGNGIMPYLDPYALNSVGIDISTMKDNVELSATEQEVVPRANQALLIDFSTQTSRVVFFELQNLSKIPPIGTEVFNEDKQSVGMLAQGGRIYARGLAEQGTLSLPLDNGKSCQFHYQLPENQQTLIIPVQCEEN